MGLSSTRTVLILVAAACIAARLPAQSTFGTILGVIKDPTGAAIPNGKVVVTNQETNIAVAVNTDGTGSYEATHLNAGIYSVAVEAAGFQRAVQRDITLESAQVLRIDMGLSVGSLTDTVTITAQAPLVESETGTISDVRTGRLMRSLPLNFVRGDGFSSGVYRYVGLTPGAYSQQGRSANSFAGTRSGQATATLDGISMGDQGGATPGPSQPSFESIQEVKLTMVNNSAEYSAVANIVMISKSGTNQLHGSLFHQYSSGGLNARNFFQSSRPFRVYNQFGGSIGGPVVLPGYNGRNRTFFFGAYEGNRDHRQRLFNVNVPTLRMREGDFSRVVNNAGNLIVVRDPLTNQPFPNNIIPRERLSPVSLRAQQKYYPAPNFGSPDDLSSNLRAAISQPPGWDHFDTRVDHQVSSRNSLYGRFTWRRLPNPAPAGELPYQGFTEQIRMIHNLAVVDTHLITPITINEFRAGYAWHENPRWGPQSGLDAVRELGIRGLTSMRDVRGVPNFTISGFAAVTVANFDRPQEMTYDLIDNLTFIRGRHSLKVGFNLKKNQTSREPVPISVFGRYDFTAAFTGFSYADFLLGIPQTTQRYSPRGRTYGRNTVLAGYIQDDYKVHPRVTLNLGLRYEWMNPFADRYDRMFNFDPATGSLVVPNQTVIERDVSPIYPSSIRIITAEQAGFPKRLRESDINNFDPRMGVAWRPLGHARTVLRAGFGVYRNNLSSTLFEFGTQGPFVSNETFTNRIVSGAPLFQFPEPFLAVGSLGAQDVTAVERNLFNPYTMQWNLSAEQEYASIGFRASYIATHSVNLAYRRNLNQPQASTIPFNNDRRPYPQFRNIIMVSNGGASNYDAFQLEAERKFAGGLYFQTGWTWAKQLAHGPDSGDEGPQIENAYDRNAEWGDELYLMRHRFVSTAVYELPFGPGRPWLSGVNGIARHVVGGWVVSGIAVLQTGQRFTPSFSGRDISNTNTTSGRPDRIANGNLPKDERTLTRWFDVSAFVVPPVNAGRFGNSGVGILEGPGTANLNFSLAKNFRFKEQGRLELAVSSTNVFNHPNFVNPASNISAPNAVGRITATQARDEAGPRTLMFNARIEF